MRFPLASLALLTLPALLAAQPTLTPTVTTASRLALTLDQMPASVTIITGRQLRDEGVTSLALALRRVPGATVAQTGSEGGLTALFLRGGQSNYTKVLVDGVPVNQAGGAYDFGTLTVDNVERIEVLRGPASVVWGSDAVAGVVNIITRDGDGQPRLEAGVQAGGRGTLDLDATLLGGTPSASYSFGAGRHTTDGIYDFNNRYRNTTVSGLGRFRPDDRTRASLSLRYTNYAAHYPTDGTGAPVDSNAFRTEDRIVLGFDADRTFGARASVAVRLASSSADGGTDDRPDRAGGSSTQTLDHIVRRSAEVRGTYQPRVTTRLTAGISGEEQSQRSQAQYGGAFAFTDQFNARRSSQAAFVEILEEQGSTTLVAGGRIDANAQFGEFATYRIAARHELPAALHVRGSVGTAFREPSFYENFATGFVRGNRDLEPERSFSWEGAIGRAFTTGATAVEVIYFDQRFRDLIDYNGAARAPEPNYQNIARASASGWEVEITSRPAAALGLDASVTWLRTRVDSGGFSTATTALLRRGEPLVRRPDVTATAGVSWRPAARWGMDLRATHVGERTDRRFTSSSPFTLVASLPAYTLVDVSGDVRLTPSSARDLRATVRVANLANEAYESVAGYRTARRTVLVGIRSSF